MTNTRTFPDTGDGWLHERAELGGLELWLAGAAVFLAPMNILRFDAFFFTASDLFASLCLLTILLNGSVRVRMLGPGTAYWMLGLVLMVGALLASSLMVGAVDRGLILSMQYIFAYLLLPIVLLGRSRRESEFLMKVFVASIVVMILHGIYVVDILQEKNTNFVSGNGRLLGFIERDNECGALIALTMPMALWLAMQGKIRPLTALALLPLLGYGIMLTGSNTALYAALLGVGLVMLALLTPRRLLAVAAVVPVLWTVLSVPAIRQMLPEAFQKRVLTGLESGNLDQAGTFADRMMLNYEAIRLGADVMLLGYGADQYREISQWQAPVHNFYLLIWNEGGLFGLAGFLFMACAVAMTLAAAARTRDGRIEAACGFATFALFLALINAVAHVYARFWVVPVLLSLTPALTFISEELGRRDRREH